MSTTRVSRLWITVVTVLGIAVSGAPSASAHVTVHPNSEPAGTSYSVLTFRVPNELNDARTVKVEIFLPTARPVTGISVRPVAGWRVDVKNKRLATPIKTPGGPLDVVPSKITWKGGSVPVGGYQDFDVSVGHVPDRPGPLVFKVLQTYSNGKVVRWIETSAQGSPEPEHPAPTVLLTAPRQPADGTDPARSDGTDRALAIAALGVALIALWLAVAGRLRRSSSQG
jgi:uncharacterized protein YcnI